MSRTEQGTDRWAAPSRAAGPVVAAPRFTRIAAAVVALGILTQATAAGGFLGTQPGWLEIHRVVGSLLPLVGLAILAAGLIGRRRSREPASVLVMRAALFLALFAEVAIGTSAGADRSLLILHIPFAFVIMGLTGNLAFRGFASRRPAPIEPAP